MQISKGNDDGLKRIKDFKHSNKWYKLSRPVKAPEGIEVMLFEYKVFKNIKEKNNCSSYIKKNLSYSDQ